MPISMRRCRRALVLACQVVVGANANVRRARLCVLGYGQPPVRPVPESSSHSMRTTCGYNGVLAPVGSAVLFSWTGTNKFGNGRAGVVASASVYQNTYT